MTYPNIAGTHSRGAFDKDAQGWCGEVLVITQDEDRVSIRSEIHYGEPENVTEYTGRITGSDPAGRYVEITLDDGSVRYFWPIQRELRVDRPR